MTHFIELDCKTPVYELDAITHKIIVSEWVDGWIYINLDRLLAIRKNIDFKGVWCLDLIGTTYEVDEESKDRLIRAIQAFDYKVM